MLAAPAERVRLASADAVLGSGAKSFSDLASAGPPGSKIPSSLSADRVPASLAKKASREGFATRGADSALTASSSDVSADRNAASRSRDRPLTAGATYHHRHSPSAPSDLPSFRTYTAPDPVEQPSVQDPATPQSSSSRDGDFRQVVEHFHLGVNRRQGGRSDSTGGNSGVAMDPLSRTMSADSSAQGWFVPASDPMASAFSLAPLDRGAQSSGSQKTLPATPVAQQPSTPPGSAPARRRPSEQVERYRGAASSNGNASPGLSGFAASWRNHWAGGAASADTFGGASPSAAPAASAAGGVNGTPGSSKKRVGGGVRTLLLGSKRSMGNLSAAVGR